MIDIHANVIVPLQAELEDLEWTIPGNAVASSFSIVKTARTFGGAEDSPYCCIDDSDNTPDVRKVATRSVNGDTVYQESQVVSIYVLAQVLEQITVEEATKRVRYATKAVAEFLKQGSVIGALTGVIGWNYLGWESVYEQEVEVIGRKLNLVIIYQI